MDKRDGKPPAPHELQAAHAVIWQWLPRLLAAKTTLRAELPRLIKVFDETVGRHDRSSFLDIADLMDTA